MPTTSHLRNRLALFVLAGALSAFASPAWATWSIVLVDTESREVAIGSATCLNAFDLEKGLPAVVVDVGAGAAQSLIDQNANNRRRIRDGLLAGTHPADILAIMAAADGQHQSRQYGIVDVLGRAITFTGTGAGAHASGVTGRVGTITYAIQGNVITGAAVIQQAEAALVNTPGDMPTKLMAAMQAARAMGGDGRCSCAPTTPTACGAPPANFTKSAHIGFMIAARTGDTDGPCTAVAGCAAGDYFMNFNFPNQSNADPDVVLQLQAAYDAWRASRVGLPDGVHTSVTFDPPVLFAEPGAATNMLIAVKDWQGLAVDAAGLDVVVAHAPDSEERSIIADGPPEHLGGGVFRVGLTSSGLSGWDRFRITIDDGVRPVVVIPMPRLVVCGTAADPGDDCDANGVPDPCEMIDCNSNGVLDRCDLARGRSEDANANGRPDECEPETLFVDSSPGGLGTGLSWRDALHDLQHALLIAAESQGRVREIRVAQGTYRPDDGTGDRGRSFVLQDGLVLRGGYAGRGGDDPAARNPGVYESVLSGDLAGDDEPHFVNRTENSFHVVIGSGVGNTAVLEGFVIRGGHANHASNAADRQGGGLRSVGGAATIRQCRFESNFANNSGGAVQNDQSDTTFEDCTFFYNQSLGLHGAAVVNSGSPASFLRCRFVGNISGAGGGAVFNTNQSHATFESCEFRNNVAGADGGALLNWTSSNPTIQRCVFAGNLATGRGGAVTNNSGSRPIIDACVFVDNGTTGLSTTSHGGAIYNSSSGSMILQHSTIAVNTAAAEGGGVFLAGTNQPAIAHTILWANDDRDGGGFAAQLRGVPASVDWSCVKGWDGSSAGVGTIAADPMFVAAIGRDLRLVPGSPCINAGDPVLMQLPGQQDHTGWPRVLCGRVDIGAHESGVADADCSGAFDAGDIDALAACLLGPDSTGDEACLAFDHGADGVVDLTDAAAAQKSVEP
jgi:hypothetical protein